MSDFIISVLVALGAAGLAYIAQRKIGTVRKADQRPHQVPWGLVLVGCVFVLFLVIVHMLNIAGVETGPENSLMGRF